MKMLIAMDWGWSEMLWVALISICLVFVVLVLLVFVMKGFGSIFGSKSEAEAANQSLSDRFTKRRWLPS